MENCLCLRVQISFEVGLKCSLRLHGNERVMLTLRQQRRAARSAKGS
jgi:hypothetical protein